MASQLPTSFISSLLFAGSISFSWNKLPRSAVLSRNGTDSWIMSLCRANSPCTDSTESYWNSYSMLLTMFTLQTWWERYKKKKNEKFGCSARVPYWPRHIIEKTSHPPANHGNVLGLNMLRNLANIWNRKILCKSRLFRNLAGVPQKLTKFIPSKFTFLQNI